MEIKYFGKSVFFIKGKTENVLINPIDIDFLSKIKEKVRTIIFSQERDNQKEWFGREEVVIFGAGEYEVGGVGIIGVNGGESIIYTINYEGLTMGVIGKIKEMPSDKKMEKIGGIDLLTADISSETDLKILTQFAKKVGTNYLIPSNFNQEELKKFLDVTDNERMEAIESLKFSVEELPEGMEVVVLKEN